MIRLGLQGKLYYNEGTWAAPVWVEVGNVRDLTLNLEKGEADVTTRANSGWRAILATLKEGTIEFEMVWDTEDPAFMVFFMSWLNDTPVECANMDGDIASAGSSGLHAVFNVTNISRSEPLEEAMGASVTVKPTYAVNAPEWLVTT